jgi:hypothetical protein
MGAGLRLQALVLPSGNPESPRGPYICASAQVLLAKRKSDGMFYAVKVLQKKSILKNKEVPELWRGHFLSHLLTSRLAGILKMDPTSKETMELGADVVPAGV